MYHTPLLLRSVGDGWAEWAIAHPGFGRSVNPISITLQLITEKYTNNEITADKKIENIVLLLQSVYD